METNKYLRLMASLKETGTGKMKCFGSSMMPILKSGSTLTFQVADEYEVGDIVFCKVNGRFIDAHKITRKDKAGRYLISNNHGHDNGWTRKIFGKVVDVE